MVFIVSLSAAAGGVCSNTPHPSFNASASCKYCCTLCFLRCSVLPLNTWCEVRLNWLLRVLRICFILRQPFTGVIACSLSAVSKHLRQLSQSRFKSVGTCLPAGRNVRWFLRHSCLFSVAVQLLLFLFFLSNR